MKRFWLLRHAVVTPEAAKFLYGRNDVPVCPLSMAEQAPRYAAIAARLPRPARLVVTPLSRTRATADALIRAGYPAAAATVEPDLIEQDFGAWQDRVITDFSGRPVDKRHPFWPIHPGERPPGGETFTDVIARVGAAMDRLAAGQTQGPDEDGDEDADEDIVVISHGGAIRAAIAHALGLGGHQALSLSVENISLSRLEYGPHGWRVVSLNEHL